jgi:hypothetical protein
VIEITSDLWSWCDLCARILKSSRQQDKADVSSSLERLNRHIMSHRKNIATFRWTVPLEQKTIDWLNQNIEKGEEWIFDQS